jgi:Nitrous oxide-stimulated promoter
VPPLRTPASQSRAIIREKRTVDAMVRIYCAEHHDDANGVCPSCRDLLAYAHQRLDRCRFGAAKPACNSCPVHCYQAARREQMRVVMRQAGPKMLLRHPWLALVHLLKERTRRAAPVRID